MGGQWYPVIDGVPCFLRGAAEARLQRFRAQAWPVPPSGGRRARSAGEQARTTETFSDKWRRFKNYGLEPQHREFLFGWYCKKFGVPDVEALKGIYRDCDLTLEVGPGSGFNSRFIAETTRGHHVALDVSEAANTPSATRATCRTAPSCRADLMDALSTTAPST